MNILLINPAIRENVEPYFHPIGLASVAAVLRNAGHEIKILDLNILRPKHDAIPDLLPDGPYDIVGVSGIISTYAYVWHMMPMLRKKYKCPIVIGGAGITSAPEVYMDNMQPDVGVLGEGEWTALELVQRLEQGRSIHDVQGIIYANKGGYITTEPRPIEKNLDAFPMIAYDLLDMETYIKNVRHDPEAEREVALLTTRGCPMACNFCYHVFGRGVRYRSVERVIEEIEYLIMKYNIGALEIGDECFTARKPFVTAFCNALIEKNLRLGWSAFSRVDTIDEETMALMVLAGCNWIGFGIESGSQRILDAMNKRVKVEKAKETFLMAKKYLRRISGTLIFGYPGENDESIEETISFLDSIKHFQNIFFLAPYPGTQVYEEQKDKIIAEYGSLHEFFKVLRDAAVPVINLTDYSHEEFMNRHQYMMIKTRENALGDSLKHITIKCSADVEQKAREIIVRALAWLSYHPDWTVEDETPFDVAASG